MEEPAEPSYQQAMQRKRDWLHQANRQTTNLMFIGSLLMIAAFILYFIPASGVAYLLTSIGAFICILAAIVFGLRAHSIEANAQRQVDTYRAALNLPRPEEATSRLDEWMQSILRWSFRLLTAVTFLASFWEIAALWQEQPSTHRWLILLGVTIFITAAGVVGMWITSPSKQKSNKDG